MRGFMTRQQRAKQFQPFDAMKGLKEAIIAVEERRSRVQKRVMSDEDVDVVNKMLVKIGKGMKVEVEYFKAFHNVVIKGIIDKIDKKLAIMEIGEEKIFFDDIYNIEIIDFA